MTTALVSITLRALLNRRRTLLLAGPGALLVLIVVLYRLGGGENPVEVTQRLLADLGLGVVLPIVAVIVGTSVVGSELDDGTIVYVLAKPIARWRIIVVKLLVAWLITCLLVVPPFLLAGLVGSGDGRLTAGYAVAAVVGALEYTTVFVALSLVTSRALIMGLAYVVIWEGVVAGLFAGTRVVSLRQHALSVAEAVGGSAAADTAEVALSVATIAAVLIILGATALAIRRLETVELRGDV